MLCVSLPFISVIYYSDSSKLILISCIAGIFTGCNRAEKTTPLQGTVCWLHLYTCAVIFDIPFFPAGVTDSMGSDSKLFVSASRELLVHYKIPSPLENNRT